jgi:hypothetical protein
LGDLLSNSNEEQVITCDNKVPKNLSSKSKSKLFFKFEVVPTYGKHDSMVSQIKRIHLFKIVNKKWIFVGAYDLNPDFTYVYEKLHDGFAQILIDIPQVSTQLSTQLGLLKFPQKYLWAPLGASGESEIYLIDSNNKLKNPIIGLDGKPKKYSKKNDSEDLK